METSIKCNATVQGSYFCSRGNDTNLDGLLKYTKCPYDALKCGAPQRKIVTAQWSQSIATTVEFGEKDTCAYVIANEMMI